jgi:hypothetical protein
MLRPVSARLQTTLTFVLYVHRPITEVEDPGVRHRAGVVRASADWWLWGAEKQRSRNANQSTTSTLG